MRSSIESIAQASKNWSIEVTPKGAGKVADFGKILAAGTTVNVTFLPNSNLQDTVDVACRQLDEFISQLVNDADIDEVLVIGGSVDKVVGPFSSSMDVLETGLLQKYGIKRVGVAGHPEGSPDISDQDIRMALEQKNRFAIEQKLEMYIETQFCFDPLAVINWEKQIRNLGNRLPIRVGIAGPATIKSLLKFGQVSGIGNSIRFIKKQARNVAKIMRIQTPAALLDGLVHGIDADHECLISHFHYYPFGGFARTVEFATMVSNGTILPTGDSEVFEVVT